MLSDLFRYFSLVLWQHAATAVDVLVDNKHIDSQANSEQRPTRT